MSELENRIARYVNDEMCSCTKLESHLDELNSMSSKFPENIDELATKYKALSEPNRLKIIFLLIENSLCACELEYILSISQPTITYHLQILQKAKLIRMEKEGKWTKIHLEKAEIPKILLEYF